MLSSKLHLLIVLFLSRYYLCQTCICRHAFILIIIGMALGCKCFKVAPLSLHLNSCHLGAYTCYPPCHYPLPTHCLDGLLHDMSCWIMNGLSCRTTAQFKDILTHLCPSLCTQTSWKLVDFYYSMYGWPTLMLSLSMARLETYLTGHDIIISVQMKLFGG